jgi:hypothetical protein
VSVEWPCRNKTCTVLHQVGVSFDLYYDARKHKIKIQTFLANTLVLWNTTEYKHWSYFSFKIGHLCKYTLLQSTEKVWGTLLEAIFWKLFQLFRRILNDVSNITKVPSLECLFLSIEHMKMSCRQARRVWKILQCFHVVLFQEILDKTWPVCWSIVMK